jgi:type IV pilus assembly protein PilC
MALIVTPGTLFRRSDFYLQLAGMFAAGVPIIQALEMLAKNRSSGKYRIHLRTVIDRLNQGFTFKEALEGTGSWLPQFDHALIGAGEESGRLDLCLKMLGNYYQQMGSMSREVIMGTLYPLFLIHLALLIFPSRFLTGIFLNNGVERFVQNKLIVFGTFYGIVIALLLLGNARFGTFWRDTLAAIGDAIPVLGKARKNLALARFCASLEALLSAGVPVIESWTLAAQACGSTPIRKAVEQAMPRVHAGATPAEVVQQMPIFPDVFRSLYATGEVSGQLDGTLVRLHTLFEENARVKFQAFREWTPRVVFLVIAVVIGYQIISFYLGYFDNINKMIQ